MTSVCRSCLGKLISESDCKVSYIKRGRENTSEERQLRKVIGFCIFLGSVEYVVIQHSETVHLELFYH